MSFWETVLSDIIYLSCGISNTQTRRSVDGEGAGYPGGDGVRDGGRNLNLTVRSVHSIEFWSSKSKMWNIMKHFQIKTFSNKWKKYRCYAK